MIILNKRPHKCLVTYDMPKKRGKVDVSTRIYAGYVLVYVIFDLELVEAEGEGVHEDHLEKVEGERDDLS